MRKLNKKEKIWLFSSLGGIAVIGIAVFVIVSLQTPKVSKKAQTANASKASSVSQSTAESVAASTVSSTSHDAPSASASTPSAATNITTQNPISVPSFSSVPRTSRPMPTYSIPNQTALHNSPLPNNNQAYEEAKYDLETEYIQQKNYLQYEWEDDQLDEMLQTKRTVEESLTACRKAWSSQVSPLKQQLTATQNEKQQVLAQILANAGGQMNSYYRTTEQQYNTRISNLRAQISSVDGKYEKQIADLEAQIENLPSLEEIRKARDLALQDLESWYQSELKKLQQLYNQ